MAASSRLSPIPHFRLPPGAPPPNFRALVIGINYTSSSDELKGPVNDAKDILKTLREVYCFRDIVLMTDEEVNRGTNLWPSAENILGAVDNLVRGACRGDVFLCYFAGHCGRQDDDENQFIVACNRETIPGSTLREHLIDPLPKKSRMTVILDACHSGSLLLLGHYSCHCMPRQRAQSFSVRRKMHTEPQRRRNSEAVGLFRIPNSASFLPRRRFKKAVTTTLAVIRFKKLLEKGSEEGEKDVVLPTPTSQQPLCHRCSPTYGSLVSDHPVVIILSACAKDQQTWEDSKRKGKGMTTKLIKILSMPALYLVVNGLQCVARDPSVKLGDLEVRLNKCLSKLAFKRLRKATIAFRKLAGMVSPKRKEKLENKYRAQGVFDFNEQTVQIGSLRRLGPEERFLLEQGCKEDLPD